MHDSIRATGTGSIHRTRLRRFHQLVSLSALIVFTTSGCILFHSHSKYRPIHQCAIDGDSACVAQDLDKRPDELELPDDAGLTPLHLVALHCRVKVAALLLAKGANPNKEANGNATPLHFAAQEGCIEVARLLIDGGADINVRDDQSRTPLGRAIAWHQDACAQFLRDHGATE